VNEGTMKKLLELEGDIEQDLSMHAGVFTHIMVFRVSD